MASTQNSSNPYKEATVIVQATRPAFIPELTARTNPLSGEQNGIQEVFQAAGITPAAQREFHKSGNPGTAAALCNPPSRAPMVRNEGHHKAAFAAIDAGNYSNHMISGLQMADSPRTSLSPEVIAQTQKLTRGLTFGDSTPMAPGGVKPQSPSKTIH